MNITFITNSNKKFTFVHIPKNAGKSISAYIMQHSAHSYTIHDKSHASIKELRATGEDLGTTFTVVRNPYTRVVSLYKYLFEDNLSKILEPTIPYFQRKPDLSWHKKLRQEYPKMSFRKFVSKLPYMPLAQPQADFLPVHNILRFEHLNKDFKYIQKQLKSKEPLFKINNTNDKFWKEYYTHDTDKIVAEKYSKDFHLLNYSKDINN